MDLNTSDYLLAYLIALVLFLVIDLIWLGLVAKKFYRAQLRSRLAKKPNKPAAVTFYALFILGLAHFAIFPSLAERDYKIAFLNGALYGFFTYMTYELTNLSVLKNWPKKLVIVDIAWGVFLAINVSAMTYLIFDMIKFS